MRKNVLLFLSGRLVALAILVAFQIFVVRQLPRAQYAVYALVLAFGVLTQTVGAMGIPRLIPKYVSQAGVSLSPLRVRRLIAQLLATRFASSLVLLVLVAAGLSLTGTPGMTAERVAAAFLFSLAGAVQVDADAMAQSLGLQIASRNCTVVEAAARLALVGWFVGVQGSPSADVVLWCSALTSGSAAVVLAWAVLRRLAKLAEPENPAPLAWPELRATALGGYSSSMAWFASSPAVLRFIAAKLLPVAVFSGYAFAQGLIISVQRYTPGSLTFPFIEPAVMRAYARTGDRSQLESALSLISKIDIFFIGAAVVGAAVAGTEVVDLITRGKYGAQAYAFVWLLIYIITNSVYRTFEIMAVALGASGALRKTLSLSLVWLVAAVLLTRELGLLALLICPIGDAASRLVVLYRGLRRAGIRRPVDLRFTAVALVVATGLGLGGREAAATLGLSAGWTIGLGVAAALLYWAGLALSRPLRRGEADLVGGGARHPVFRLMPILTRA